MKCYGFYVGKTLTGVFPSQEYAEAALVAWGALAMQRYGFVPDYSIVRVTWAEVEAAWKDWGK